MFALIWCVAPRVYSPSVVTFRLPTMVRPRALSSPDAGSTNQERLTMKGKKTTTKPLHMSCQGLRSAMEFGLISVISRWLTTEKLIISRCSCLWKYITKDGLRRADRAAGWFSVAPGHSGRGEEEEEEVEGCPAVSQVSKLHLYTQPVTLLSK